MWGYPANKPRIRRAILTCILAFGVCVVHGAPIMGAVGNTLRGKAMVWPEADGRLALCSGAGSD